ncbi:uncharacterized protein LOC129595756 [Paramacrobiotus metropolitanus]|uniref:uncharacterized protein LOC129595756 n=1 Tax=Paramacrobiotus metropolitanus TaxID=2943436 RepID=UPI002445F2A8|nr:uncharacterized protein LOC129595756 [Paramacrobiotus metropolitanus]
MTPEVSSINLWKPDTKPSSHSRLIPTFKFRLAQVFAMHPYTVPWTSLTTPPPVDFPLAVHSAGVITGLLFCFTVWAGGLATVYRQQLSRLEFFSLVSFLFKMVIYLQGPVLLIVGIFKSRQLPVLVERLERSLGTVVPRDVMLCRNCFRALIALWTVAYVALCLFSYVYAFRNIAGLINEIVTGYLRGIHLYNGPPAPDYTFTLVMGVMIGIGLICETFPVLFVMTLLREIKRGFGNINKELHRLRHNPESVEVEVGALRKQYRTLQCHVLDVDAAFAPMILVQCIREFIGCIAILGALMQFNLERVGDAASQIIDDSTKHMVFGFGIMGVVNMIIKMYVAVSTHDEAQKVRINLRKILARARSAAFISECKDFLSECEKTDGAVSAGGFLYITKESAATLVEMIITYAILIYQARDTKQDIANLPTRADLRSLHAEMRERTHLCTLLSSNVSAKSGDLSTSSANESRHIS